MLARGSQNGGPKQPPAPPPQELLTSDRPTKQEWLQRRLVPAGTVATPIEAMPLPATTPAVPKTSKPLPATVATPIEAMPLPATMPAVPTVPKEKFDKLKQDFDNLRRELESQETPIEETVPKEKFDKLKQDFDNLRQIHWELESQSATSAWGFWTIKDEAAQLHAELKQSKQASSYYYTAHAYASNGWNRAYIDNDELGAYCKKLEKCVKGLKQDLDAAETDIRLGELTEDSLAAKLDLAHKEADMLRSEMAYFDAQAEVERQDRKRRALKTNIDSIRQFDKADRRAHDKTDIYSYSSYYSDSVETERGAPARAKARAHDKIAKARAHDKTGIYSYYSDSADEIVSPTGETDEDEVAVSLVKVEKAESGEADADNLSFQ